jgi:hypothetical protein
MVEASSDWPPQFELMKLQARKPDGGDWIDIFPAQVGWMAKNGHDIRALESPPSSSGARGMREAMQQLLLTAKLLQQNSVGCAVNHHGLDLERQGLPGWLVDTQKSIDAAALALALPASARMDPERS